MTLPFPRQPDGKPHAWGLTGDAPSEIWERFSPAYEAQAEALWNEFSRMGLIPALEWAGSQDGEAVIGRDDAGEIVMLFHLEMPGEAQALHQAITENRLAAFIRSAIAQAEHEAAAYRDPAD
ncbi:MAG: hypothetical protein Q4G25_01860 [Paracoccus sp. (in: a-proteobacteria)]|nr:hypothetical protein [Paracoccus sp. (in: a-proteobacteria)]